MKYQVKILAVIGIARTVLLSFISSQPGLLFMCGMLVKKLISESLLLASVMVTM